MTSNSGILGAVQNAVTSPVTSIENFLGVHAEDFVVVVVGIILIAAGLFGFKAVGSVSQQFGKGVVEGAKGAITT
jgi:hypothetical protein